VSNNRDRLDAFYTALLEQGRIRKKRRARFYHRFLFQGLNFAGKRVLDIGGGDGVLTLYAALLGARQAICLEPEAEGATKGASSSFDTIKNRLGLLQAEIRPITLQAFDPGDARFDVIVLHNSVNHLDEDACIHLLERPAARRTFLDIFAKIAFLSESGATLIVSDCSRYNFFNLIHVRHPLVPQIAWHKHQAPDVWASLLQEAGFRQPKIRWSSFNALYSVGRLLLGNRVAAYFLLSHFCLTMVKA
jgi:SAM-dependent methyltransferase